MAMRVDAVRNVLNPVSADASDASADFVTAVSRASSASQPGSLAGPVKAAGRFAGSSAPLSLYGLVRLASFSPPPAQTAPGDAERLLAQLGRGRSLDLVPGLKREQVIAQLDDRYEIKVSTPPGDNGTVRTTEIKDPKTGRTVIERYDLAHGTYSVTVKGPGVKEMTAPVRDGSGRKVSTHRDAATGGVTRRVENDLGDGTVIETTRLANGTVVTRTTPKGGKTTVEVTAPDGTTTRLRADQKPTREGVGSIVKGIADGKSLEQIVKESSGLTREQVIAQLRAVGYELRVAAPGNGHAGTTEVRDVRTGKVVASYSDGGAGGSRTSRRVDEQGNTITVVKDGKGGVTRIVVDAEGRQTTTITTKVKGRTQTTVQVVFNGYTLTTSPGGRMELTDEEGNKLKIKRGTVLEGLARALLASNPHSSDPAAAKQGRIVKSFIEGVMAGERLPDLIKAARGLGKVTQQLIAKYGAGSIAQPVMNEDGQGGKVPDFQGAPPPGPAPSGGKWTPMRIDADGDGRLEWRWVDPKIAKAIVAEGLAWSRVSQAQAKARQSQAQFDVHALTPADKKALKAARATINAALEPYGLRWNPQQPKGRLSAAQVRLNQANEQLKQASGARLAYEEAGRLLGEAITKQAALRPVVCDPKEKQPVNWELKQARAKAARAEVTSLFYRIDQRRMAGDLGLAALSRGQLQEQLVLARQGGAGAKQIKQLETRLKAATAMEGALGKQLTMADAYAGFYAARSNVAGLGRQGEELRQRLVDEYNRNNRFLFEPGKQHQRLNGKHLGLFQRQEVVVKPDGELWIINHFEEGTTKAQLSAPLEGKGSLRSLRNDPLNRQLQGLVSGSGLKVKAIELKAGQHLNELLAREGKEGIGRLDRQIAGLTRKLDALSRAASIHDDGSNKPAMTRLRAGLSALQKQRAEAGQLYKVNTDAASWYRYLQTQPLKLLEDAASPGHYARVLDSYLDKHQGKMLDEIIQPRMQALYRQGQNNTFTSLKQNDIIEALQLDTDTEAGREALKKVTEEIGNAKVRIVPLFYVDEQVGVRQTALLAIQDGGKTRYVDVTGKTFGGLKDFQDNNRQFGEDGKLVVPVGLQMMPGANGKIALDVVKARNVSKMEKFADPVIGLVGTGATVASFTPLAPVAAPVALASGLYLGSRAAYAEVQHFRHGGEWNDTESLMNIGMVATTLLPTGSGALRTAGMRGMLVAGQPMALRTAARASIGAVSTRTLADRQVIAVAGTYMKSASKLNRTARIMDWTAMGTGVPLMATSARDLALNHSQMSGLQFADAITGLSTGTIGTGLGAKNLINTNPRRNAATPQAPDHPAPNNPPVVHTIPLSDMGSLNMAQLDPTLVPGLTREHMARLTRKQLKDAAKAGLLPHFTQDQISAVPIRLTRFLNLGALDPNQIPGLTHAHMARITRQQLDDAARAGLLAYFTRSQLAHVPEVLIRHVDVGELGSKEIPLEWVPKLSDDQIRTLLDTFSTDQVEALTRPQVEALTQLGQLSRSQFGKFTLEQFSWMTTRQREALSVDQLTAFRAIHRGAWTAPEREGAFSSLRRVIDRVTRTRVAADPRAAEVELALRSARFKEYQAALDTFGTMATGTFYLWSTLPPNLMATVGAVGMFVRGGVFIVQAAAPNGTAPTRAWGRFFNAVSGLSYIATAPGSTVPLLLKGADPIVNGSFVLGGAIYGPQTLLMSFTGKAAFKTVATHFALPGWVVGCGFYTWQSWGSPIAVTAGTLFTFGCAEFYASGIRSGLRDRRPAPISEAEIQKASERDGAWGGYDRLTLGWTFGGGMVLFGVGAIPAWVGWGDDQLKQLWEKLTSKEEADGPNPWMRASTGMTPPPAIDLEPGAFERPQALKRPNGHEQEQSASTSFIEVRLEGSRNFSRTNPDLEQKGYSWVEGRDNDSIRTLANTYGVDVVEMVMLNMDHILNPGIIFPGDRIYLPNTAS